MNKLGNLHISKPFKLPKKKFLIIGGIIVVVAIILSVKFLGASTADATILTGTVTKGDISLTITGSGTLEPLESYDVTPLVEGEITADYITEGQSIEDGDLLYEISHDDMTNSIEQSQLNVEKAQMSYKEAVDDMKNLNVTSPIAGTIETLYVDEGDSVSEGTVIADISNNDSGVITVPFVSAVAEKLYVGESAQVLLDGTFQTVTGRVTRIATGKRIVEDYVKVTDIEVTLDDPQNIYAGQSCEVTIGGYGSPFSGTFSYGDQGSIIAKASGTIENLKIASGDAVKKGATVATISNTSLATAKTNSYISLRNAQLSLQNLYDELEKYNITSPISGTVIEKTSKAGDTLDGNSSTTMAVIADMSKMVFTIDVDELDITDISVGQEVTVTADATPNVTYTGSVSNIRVIGTTSDGVTTYPVEIEIAEYGDLISGMNVNAEIIVDESKDSLLIPVAALNRGNLVAVQDSSLGTTSDSTTNNTTSQTTNNTTSNNTNHNSKTIQTPTAPDGFTYVQVEVGLSNDNYVEILSGLREGQVVLLTNTATTTVTTTQMGMGMGGMTGGGGEPPSNASGGPPSGRQ